MLSTCFYFLILKVKRLGKARSIQSVEFLSSSRDPRISNQALPSRKPLQHQTQRRSSLPITRPRCRRLLCKYESIGSQGSESHWRYDLRFNSGYYSFWKFLWYPLFRSPFCTCLISFLDNLPWPLYYILLCDKLFAFLLHEHHYLLIFSPILWTLAFTFYSSFIFSYFTIKVATTSHTSRMLSPIRGSNVMIGAQCVFQFLIWTTSTLTENFIYSRVLWLLLIFAQFSLYLILRILFRSVDNISTPSHPSRVTVVSEDIVRNAQAYQLFYQRRKSNKRINEIRDFCRGKVQIFFRCILPINWDGKSGDCLNIFCKFHFILGNLESH